MDWFSPEELLFEIPVYRLSFDGYHQALTKRVRQAGDDYVANRPSWDTQTDVEAREYAETHERGRYGRPYWYNEMIGVIRLYQDGGSIKGHFWGQPHRVFRWNFRHYQYDQHGRVLEYHSDPVPRSSRDIYEDLREYLSSLTGREGPLAGRHVDLYAFERVGPHIDWTAVLGWRSA